MTQLTVTEDVKQVQVTDDAVTILEAGIRGPQGASGAGGGGGGTWGSITGTLSAQTDLQTALNGKANTSHTHTASQITDFAEAVDDEVAALLVAGSNISLTYNDGANTLTIASTGGGGGSLGLNMTLANKQYGLNT